VKLYADEPGAEVIRALETVVVSAMARVEVPAALWRKHRIGELQIDATGELVEAFERDFRGTLQAPPRFAAVAVAAEVLDEAARRVASQRLRANDAVQLASALGARAADPSCGAFACFDDELRDAAAASGFSLVP
jgi:uncharacterized protein